MLEPLSLIIGILAGLLVGALIVFLLLNRKNQQLQASNARARAEWEVLAAGKKKGESEQHRQQEQVLALTADLNRMSADYDNLVQRFSEREKEVREIQAHYQTEFENMAQRILDKNSEKLSRTSNQQLDQLLSPLKERLTHFEKKVEETYDRESRERLILQKEIEQLMGLNQQMSADARNLTKALKGDSKAQGNWGELILSRVLESSGLRSGEEFVVQAKDMSLTAENGQRLQPDVIVRLPEEKHLVIDSKVSLTAYERFVEAEEEPEQQAFLRQHLDSLTTHINQLSDKHYHNLNGLNSPDFVLLFMPIEPAFSIALQARTDLFSYAWDRRIVLVSPTTLLATLKTVASIWKMEHQNKNAIEIARQGGALYDKFVGFVEEMEKIGKHLGQAQGTYTDAMNKLKDGRGNLASRAEKLRKLGARTQKKLKDS